MSNVPRAKPLPADTPLEPSSPKRFPTWAWFVIAGAGISLIPACCCGVCVFNHFIMPDSLSRASKSSAATKQSVRLKHRKLTTTFEGMDANSWIRLFKDRDFHTHWDANHALVVIGDECVPLIVDLMLDDKNAAICQEAAELLAQLGDVEAIPALDYVAEHETDDGLVKAAKQSADFLRKK